MSKPIIKANLKGSDKIELKYNNRGVDMTLSDFKLYLDEVLEPTNAVLTSSEPLRYKALLSQNAPVATTQTPSILAGQIWEDTIGTADAGDLVILGGYELISGTLGAVNAKYRSATNGTPNFTTASLEYDGSPYIVSTDTNGDFNPFVNTLGGNCTFNYAVPGRFGILSTSLFGSDISKCHAIIGNNITAAGIDVNLYYKNPSEMILNSFNTIETDDILSYTTISIEVYP